MSEASLWWFELSRPKQDGLRSFISDANILSKNSVFSWKRVHFSILDSFEEEDSKKLKIIMDSVLVPTKNREERKARVNKYLLWVRNIGQLPNSCTEDS